MSGPSRLVLFLWCSLCSSAGVVFAHLDINDILSVRLMPMSLLMLDTNNSSKMASRNGNESPMNATSNLDEPNHDGSFGIAYSTMGFHRKMIKEYMCSNFLASNILHEVAPSHFENRLGIASYDNESIDAVGSNHLVDAMRFDQGSSGYKDWLSKTTTLDDIYRHYNPSQSSPSPKINLGNHRAVSSRRQDKPVHEEYEEGDITGYAMPHQSDNLGGLYPQPSYHLNHHHHQPGFDVYPTAGSKAEYPFYLPNAENVYPYDQIGPPIVYDHFESTPSHAPSAHSFKDKLWNLLNPFRIFSKPYHSHYQPHLGYDYGGGGGDSHDLHSSHSSSSKEMGLKDLFDIALTTLAFLSFGMFILQVIMCVTMSKSENSNMMILPMEEIPDDGTEGLRRRRRSTTGSHYVLSLANMNELTKTVLTSIDAVQMAHSDNGKCLRYSQCASNKMSRQLASSQKIWIPIWNLGLSWLSSRVIQSQPKTSSILESLKASAYGLGKADCARLYSCTKNYVISKTKK